MKRNVQQDDQLKFKNLRDSVGPLCFFSKVFNFFIGGDVPLSIRVKTLLDIFIFLFIIVGNSTVRSFKDTMFVGIFGGGFFNSYLKTLALPFSVIVIGILKNKFKGFRLSSLTLKMLIWSFLIYGVIFGSIIFQGYDFKSAEFNIFGPDTHQYIYVNYQQYGKIYTLISLVLYSIAYLRLVILFFMSEVFITVVLGCSFWANLNNFYPTSIASKVYGSINAYGNIGSFVSGLLSLFLLSSLEIKRDYYQLCSLVGGIALISLAFTIILSKVSMDLLRRSEFYSLKADLPNTRFNLDDFQEPKKSGKKERSNFSNVKNVKNIRKEKPLNTMKEKSSIKLDYYYYYLYRIYYILMYIPIIGVLIETICKILYEMYKYPILRYMVVISCSYAFMIFLSDSVLTKQVWGQRSIIQMNAYANIIIGVVSMFLGPFFSRIIKKQNFTFPCLFISMGVIICTVSSLSIASYGTLFKAFTEKEIRGRIIYGGVLFEFLNKFLVFTMTTNRLSKYVGLDPLREINFTIVKNKSERENFKLTENLSARAAKGISSLYGVIVVTLFMPGEMVYTTGPLLSSHIYLIAVVICSLFWIYSVIKLGKIIDPKLQVIRNLKI